MYSYEYYYLQVWERTFCTYNLLLKVNSQICTLKRTKKHNVSSRWWNITYPTLSRISSYIKKQVRYILFRTFKELVIHFIVIFIYCWTVLYFSYTRQTQCTRHINFMKTCDSLHTNYKTYCTRAWTLTTDKVTRSARNTRHLGNVKHLKYIPITKLKLFLTVLLQVYKLSRRSHMMSYLFVTSVNTLNCNSNLYSKPNEIIINTKYVNHNGSIMEI